MAVRRPPSRSGARALVPAVPAVLLLAWLWLVFGDGLTHATSGGGGRGGTVLAAAVRREDDRARLTVEGRLRSGGSGAPVAVRVLGSTDVAAPCPVPRVTSSTVLARGDGVRVGWRPVAGGRPGWALERGRRFAMTGTVGLPAARALRLCVHLVRGGARPTVLRTTEVVVPDVAGMTPLWAGVRPLLTERVVPAARVVLVLLAVAVALRVLILLVRRRARGRRRRPGPPSAEPSPSDVLVPASDAASPPGDRRSADRSTDLPPLPPGVAVPDAPPWPVPEHDGSAAGSSARRQAQRRADRWRARRRREAEGAGRPYDAREPLPRHVAVWGVGAAGEQLAAERFAACASACPSVHVLHDRRATKRAWANIDHVLIGPAGVVVADTKHWAGTVQVLDGRLVVRGRDRTAAVDGVLGQVEKVRDALVAGGHGTVPVAGVLHWTLDDGVRLDGTLAVRGVPLLDAPGTMRRAAGPAVLDDDAVARVLACLDTRLPPAR